MGLQVQSEQEGSSLLRGLPVIGGYASVHYGIPALQEVYSFALLGTAGNPPRYQQDTDDRP